MLCATLGGGELWQSQCGENSGSQGALKGRQTGPEMSSQMSSTRGSEGEDRHSERLNEINNGSRVRSETLNKAKRRSEEISSQNRCLGRSTGLGRKTNGGRSVRFNLGNAGTSLGPTKATLQRRGGSTSVQPPGVTPPAGSPGVTPAPAPVHTGRIFGRQQVAVTVPTSPQVGW